jgi:hypothetical protein
LFDRVRDVHKPAPRRDLEPKMFSERFHALHPSGWAARRNGVPSAGLMALSR